MNHVVMKALQLGKGSLIAKIDIKSAYRLVPVSPLDSHYLGTKWDGQICRWYVPFELRSAPKIFNALADALEWCMNKEYRTYSITWMILPLLALQTRSNAAGTFTFCRESVRT